MDYVAVSASMRRLRKLTCASAGVPAVQYSDSGNGTLYLNPPTGTGVDSVQDQKDSYVSSDAGVAPFLTVLPAIVGTSGTPTITIYGYRLVGSDWHAILLAVMSATCNLAVTSASASSNSIANGDNVASAITVSSSGGCVVTAGGSNPATVKVPTLGCPYICVTSSVANTYIAYAPQY